MKTITREQLQAWEPCYSSAKLDELIGPQKRLDVEFLLSLDIPETDKLWVLLHEEIIPEKELHLLACEYAERALKRERKAGREPDARSWAAITAKRDWVAGKISDAELSAADAAACAAADAAYAAADAAAYSAADAAADAAYAAACAAADAAEIQWQLKQAVAAAGGEL